MAVATKMQVLGDKLVRESGTRVKQLFDPEAKTYYAECEHGRRVERPTRTASGQAMSHPAEWCPKCRKAAQAREQKAIAAARANDRIDLSTS
jgi:predicted nucleic-acid-binding Zn-ribbon protein